jgi:CheY-like chemotaxis protein
MFMPRCDGPTTIRAIRSNPSYETLKIFAVSGYPPDQFGLSPTSGGFNRWFQKPLDPEILLKELNRELAPRA